MIQVYAPHNEMDDEEEERHKATQVSANGRVRNQIEHVLINGQWRSSVLDTSYEGGRCQQLPLHDED